MSGTENTTSRRSIIEQILNKMFETLDSKDVFDTDTIQELRELASGNDLSKPKKVEGAIKSASGRTR